MTHCFSCGAAVKDASVKEKAYCEYCTDENGDLKSKEEIRNGIAGWLTAWAVDAIDEQEALRRAELYMLSMPAWAENNMN